MHVTVKEPFLSQLKSIKKVDEYLRYHSWNKNVALKIDVGELVEAELKKLMAVLKSDPDANARALKTVELFEKAKDNPKNTVPKSLEQFAVALKGYIATIPKYRIYQQGEDGDWKAYAATSVGYVKAKTVHGHRYPAYVFLKAAYYNRGDVSYSAWNFYAAEIRNKTCAEILDDSYLMVGSPELDAQYEKEVTRYKDLRGAVGKQLWGTGSCQSVDNGWRRTSYSLDVDGRRARLVVDAYVEGSDRRKNESTEGEAPVLDASFWKNAKISDDDDDETSKAEESTVDVIEVPLLPVVLLFNLEKHSQCWAHVNRLEDYVYDKTLGDKLVLPEYQRELIEILVQRDRAEMQDIIAGKAGGSIVLCSGAPGTGKTLTAEVFAETIERPLYVVASSQLGTDAGELEKELKLVLDRASRLGAIMLLDECDVYIRSRGDDLIQNSIVGCFLRILEYFSGVMFMTTNRETTIDDAIRSRCTAQVKYEVPTPDGQKKIWKILSEISGIKLDDKEVSKFVKDHPKLVGRDVKGLLKLANMVAVRRKEKITGELLEFVMKFKPTAEDNK